MADKKLRIKLTRSLIGLSPRQEATVKALGLRRMHHEVVHDDTARTLCAADSRSKEFRAQHKTGGNAAAAKAVGELLAQKAKAAGIEHVVFDRGGYKYHGRVKALADAARAGGLAF